MMQALILCAETSALRDFVQSKPPNHPSLPVETAISVVRSPPSRLTAHKTDFQQQKLLIPSSLQCDCRGLSIELT